MPVRDGHPMPPHVARWRESGLDIGVEPMIVHVAGDVDAATAPGFSHALVLSERPIVQALDLSGVTFFSAAGVRCFVERRWSIRPHPIVIASPAVRRVLDVVGLDHLLAAHGWRSAFDGWTLVSTAS